MSDYQVPRRGFAWLLVAQAFLLFPHILRFPVLLVPLWVICFFWRIMIYQGRWTYPSGLMKTNLVILSVIAIVLLEKRWLSVEATVLTLLVSFLLKLVEMKDRRDVFVVICLAYFAIVAELLFTQSLLAAAYLVVSLLLVTATLVAIHVADHEATFFYPARVAARIMALSIPVMLVGFLVFPRLDPLWSVPMPKGSGKTGVSGTMSPGDFSQLAKSGELAFRAEFYGDMPPLTELYWRGIVLTTFDGRTWKPLFEESLAAPVYDDILITDKTPLYKYRVVMEPTSAEWMFPLAGTVVSDADAFFFRDFTLKNHDAIDQRESWYFESYPDAAMGMVTYRYQLNAAVNIPRGFNPRAKELALSIFGKSASPEDFVARILDYFRQEPFSYTLNPPLLERDSIDDFLFNKRQGFCEHYASAFVFLVRAAGIPARVVVGYQGGDINPYERHITVRQLDAHSWAEVWFEGKGWVRFDPTYAVAPERIESGSQQSLQDQEGFLEESPLSPIRYSGFSYVKKLQQRLDQANFLWHSWVLGYRGEKQQYLLKGLLGDLSIRSLALFMLSAFIAVPLCMAIYFSYKHRPLPLSRVEKIYRRYTGKLAKKGLKKLPSEGAIDFLKKSRQKWPASAAAMENITRQYLLLNYASQPGGVDEQQMLKKFRDDVSGFNV